MSIIFLRNKLNPLITRQFPKRAWEILDKSSKLKQEWEPASTINDIDVKDVSPVPEIKKASFVPPEIKEVKKRTRTVKA